MKEFGGSGDLAPPVLNLNPKGGEWPASCPDRFTAWEIAPVTPCVGDWVGYTAGLDALVKRKMS
jgi:hypothetical protein